MNRALSQLREIEICQTIRADAAEIQGLQEKLAATNNLVHHHRTLRTKYELAAVRPWLLFPPDPPNPHPYALRSTREEWEWERKEFPWLPAEPAMGFYPDEDGAVAKKTRR